MVFEQTSAGLKNVDNVEKSSRKLKVVHILKTLEIVISLLNNFPMPSEI